MPSSVRSQDVEVMAGASALRGILTVPAGASGVVLFAHGSGSGRLSPRNNFVARIIQDAGVATLLIDLLTAEEERADARTGHLRFDIDFLTRRLLAATEWLHGAEGSCSGPGGGVRLAKLRAARCAMRSAARHRQPAHTAPSLPLRVPGGGGPSATPSRGVRGFLVEDDQVWVRDLGQV